MVELISISGLSVSYGGHRAVNNISINVSVGETVVMLGANGAGKTTLLNTISGLLRAEAGGTIVFDNLNIENAEPHEIVEHGISIVPEGKRIFGTLSVKDNLNLGAFPRRAQKDKKEQLHHVFDLFPRLLERRKQIARTMSGGEQQMLAIARALMAKPRLLLLDEPSLGLSPVLSKELFNTLEKISDSGVSILLVEQNARRSLRISERGYLLENGNITVEGSAEQLRNDKTITETYLGV